MNEISESSLLYKPFTDIVGAISSTLCMVHCLLTPLLFAAHAASSVTCSEIGPLWWKLFDFVFLIVSIVAIRFAVKTTSLQHMPTLMYVTWGVLAILVVNNFFHVLPVPHAMIYVPAIGLAALHLYNRKYCTCRDGSCCTA